MLSPSSRAVPQVAVAMIGARRHYAVPKLLQQAGMLDRFYTDIYAAKMPWARRLLASLPPALLPAEAKRFLGRVDPEIPVGKVEAFPLFAASYWWKRRRRPEHFHEESIRAFNQKVVRRSVLTSDIVYGFNCEAREIFEYARDRGIPCILDQTSLPRDLERRWLEEEMELWPGWQPTLQRTVGELDKLHERESAEWELADAVVGGSEFAVGGVIQHGVSPEKCHVVPTGIRLRNLSSGVRVRDAASPRLRVLFAGTVGLQKGTQYLIEAARLLGPRQVEVRIAGTILLNPAVVQKSAPYVTFLGPVPRAQMEQLYQWADILVLPSLCEGSAMVSYEALAAGVPVLTTPNAGTLTRHEIDGLIVPVRDASALAAAMERFSNEAGFRASCSQNALNDRHRLGMDAYRQRLVAAVLSIAAGARGGAELRLV